MSKVATYLQEHILGEVTINPAILKALSKDAGVLEVMPEMAIYPRVTNDIRKIARFAWQLAEKGHVLPITARGDGTDETGGAIGKGISLITPAHMNRLFELDVKQKLVRVQPGMNTQALNAALMLQGVAIPSLPAVSGYGTVGGAVVGNKSGVLSGKYGGIGKWVHQLEVVLASGDVLQTGRLSKRELNKKKGLQTLEGEIYRTLDNLIDDNKQLFEEKIRTDIPDNVGYSSIVNVKQRDGSFDLTPLIVGSQGTLGLVSEMILKCEFMSTHHAVAVASFTSHEVARDMIDQLRTLEPAFLEYFDGEIFATAAKQGKRYSFIKDVNSVDAVVLLGFDDFSERHRQRKLKKAMKLLEKAEAHVEGAEGEEALELLAAQEATAYSMVPEGTGVSAPPILDGAYVPYERFEEFLSSLKALSVKHHVPLPLHSHVLSGIIYVRPPIHMHKVADKQKIFKLLDEYADLVDQFDGHLIGEGGEGRVKARFAYKNLDPEVMALFEAIKNAFDPYGILNPEVKQSLEVRQLVSKLRSDYDTALFPSRLPYN